MRILISLLAFASAIAPCLAARAQDPAPPPPAPAAPAPAAPVPAAPAPVPVAPAPAAPAPAAPAPAAPAPAAPAPVPVAPAPVAPAPVPTGAENLLPPPVTPWGPAAPPTYQVAPGLPHAEYVPSEEEPVSPSRRAAEEYAQLRHGFHPGVSVGFAALPVAALVGASASFIANFGMSRNVDLRAGVRLAAGAGFNGFGPDGVVEVPLSVRFNIGTVYTIGLGFNAGALLLSSSDCQVLVNGVFESCGRSATPYFLFGPELTFLSFRAGAKREVEIELSGGPNFIAPPSGVVLYPRVSLSVAYMLL